MCVGAVYKKTEVILFFLSRFIFEVVFCTLNATDRPSSQTNVTLAI